MPELWDLLDENRMPIGHLHLRGNPLPEGFRHLVVEVFTFHNGKLLTTLRHPDKHNGNFWEVTTGSALAGESSVEAAARELSEETGICLPTESFHLFKTIVKPRFFSDLYYIHLPNTPDIFLQAEETVDFRWVTLEEMDQMCQSGIVIPHLSDRFCDLLSDLKTISAMGGADSVHG